MSTNIKNFLTFFALQFWTYGVVCISWRAVAQADIAKSVLVDVIFGAANWFVIKKIAKEESGGWGFAGYTLGGATGTAVGIWASLLWLGK